MTVRILTMMLAWGALVFVAACSGSGDGGGGGDRDGDGDGDGDGDTAQDAGAQEECEEVCFETAACDPSIDYDEEDCAMQCVADQAYARNEGCAAEYRALMVCRAGSNDCPLPDCLAETRAYESCESEPPCGDECGADELYCAEACEADAACGAQIGADCSSICLSEIVMYGCLVERQALLACNVDNDACTLGDLQTFCGAELQARDDCFGR